MFKVYHKKYTKDEGVLVGVERINEQSGNWEYNTVTDTEWKLGTIAIKEGQGMLERKQFITTDVDGELLFEGDRVHADYNEQDEECEFSISFESLYKIGYKSEELKLVQ